MPLSSLVCHSNLALVRPHRGQVPRGAARFAPQALAAILLGHRVSTPYNSYSHSGIIKEKEVFQAAAFAGGNRKVGLPLRRLC